MNFFICKTEALSGLTGPTKGFPIKPSNGSTLYTVKWTACILDCDLAAAEYYMLYNVADVDRLYVSLIALECYDDLLGFSMTIVHKIIMRN